MLKVERGVVEIKGDSISLAVDMEMLLRGLREHFQKTLEPEKSREVMENIWKYSLLSEEESMKNFLAESICKTCINKDFTELLKELLKLMEEI